jgi:hypothetical protein
MALSGGLGARGRDAGLDPLVGLGEGRYFPESGSVITLMAIGCRARDRQVAAVEGTDTGPGTFNTEVIMVQLTSRRASGTGVSLRDVTVGSDPAVLIFTGGPGPVSMHRR